MKPIGACSSLKSEKTYEMEEIITLATWKLGRCGCAEVGLGDEGIVDYISIELGGERIVRCYELKITKSDFLSDAKKTFIGEYNFYVIPTELWMDVKNYIEPGIGCWCIDPDGTAVRKKSAKRRQCKLQKSYITLRIMQCLERDHMKYVEQAWYDRQSRRHALDMRGGQLSVGDIVRYQGKEWELVKINRVRDGTSLRIQCIITPNGWGGTDQAKSIKPTMLTRIDETYR